MSDSVSRFSNRVDNYVKYRPGYPPEVLETFKTEMNLSESSVIADIGAGTGISAKIFLENENKVFGIEPNAAMREAAREFLRGFPYFKSIDGTAENTNLLDHSVDFVVAAQAFHWFDLQRTRAEFRRILRENGWIALIWNERQLDASEFLREYEKLLIRYAADYEKYRHDNLNEDIFYDFFQQNFITRSFLNIQTLDFAGLKGRVLSSSYMPSAEDILYEPMIAELQRLFDKFAENGKIQISYNTNIYFTQF